MEKSYPSFFFANLLPPKYRYEEFELRVQNHEGVPMK